ncbi:MAG: adenine deaminase, partial [Flavisolibacter sp.]
MKTFTVTGKLVDVHQKKIYRARITVEGERIKEISPLPDLSLRKSPESFGPVGEGEANAQGQLMEESSYAGEPFVSGDNGEYFILPGFIDSHVHIESSMLIPSEFARLAVVHGTVGTVSDPHEIANVCGMKGVEYMIDNGKTVPFKFNFGAPSCVPATSFETAGAVVDSKDIDKLMRREEILYLSEMMNFPGVLNGDNEVKQKITSAKKYNKPVDGHAPGLRGEIAKRYIDAGISTDHECFTAEEALDKLQHGMKILIREGSAAKNFDALIDLLNDHEDMMMFCSDDKHPDSLVDGHINQLCARAVAKGIDVFKVLKAACVNPVGHYKLKVGLLRQNDFADFVLVKDLKEFEVVQTYVNGELVAENGKTLIESKTASVVNNFDCAAKKVDAFLMAGRETGDTASQLPSGEGKKGSMVPIIEALDGQLITNRIETRFQEDKKILESNVDDDVLKIVVVNRYKDAPIAKAVIKNFGLKKGAIASSVAHDSHNIVAVGVDDESICEAINLVIENKGGVSCVGTDKEMILPLPVAGLMSTEDGYEVAKKYSAIDRAAKELGSKLSAPYMTLSFMALLVIPHLKL